MQQENNNSSDFLSIADKLMKERGLSSEALSSALELNEKYVTHVRGGRLNPSDKVLKKLKEMAKTEPYGSDLTRMVEGFSRVIGISPADFLAYCVRAYGPQATADLLRKDQAASSAPRGDEPAASNLLGVAEKDRPK